ncbi:unnamed protein product [Gadus morhua 'NCC']
MFNEDPAVFMWPSHHAPDRIALSLSCARVTVADFYPVSRGRPATFISRSPIRSPHGHNSTERNTVLTLYPYATLSISRPHWVNHAQTSPRGRGCSDYALGLLHAHPRFLLTPASIPIANSSTHQSRLRAAPPHAPRARAPSCARSPCAVPPPGTIRRTAEHRPASHPGHPSPHHGLPHRPTTRTGPSGFLRHPSLTAVTLAAGRPPRPDIAPRRHPACSDPPANTAFASLSTPSYRPPLAATTRIKAASSPPRRQLADCAWSRLASLRRFLRKLPRCCCVSCALSCAVSPPCCLACAAACVPCSPVLSCCCVCSFVSCRCPLLLSPVSCFAGVLPACRFPCAAGACVCCFRHAVVLGAPCVALLSVLVCVLCCALSSSCCCVCYTCLVAPLPSSLCWCAS